MKKNLEGHGMMSYISMLTIHSDYLANIKKQIKSTHVYDQLYLSRINIKTKTNTKPET